MCLPPLRGRITHLGGGKPRRRTHLPRMQHQGGMQCNGSPTGGGALSKPQTAPPLNTTIDICTGAYLFLKHTAHSSICCTVCNVLCIKSTAMLSCTMHQTLLCTVQSKAMVVCSVRPLWRAITHTSARACGDATVSISPPPSYNDPFTTNHLLGVNHQHPCPYSPPHI